MSDAYTTGSDEQYSLNLHAHENGALNGGSKGPLSRRSSECCEDGSAWKVAWCYKSRRGRCVIPEACFYFGIVGMLLNLTLVILTIFLAGRTTEICPVSLPPVLVQMADPCPDGWIWYRKKCYYFSLTEGNWNSSSKHCSSYNASLAVIDSPEERDFLLRYKSHPNHWIGLHRDFGQSWKWVNGSVFKDWVSNEEGRSCGYMNHKILASSSCTREERWICSRLAKR